MKDIEKRKTLEEDFAEAMTDMKSTFVDFVNGGSLKKLAGAIKSVANGVNFFANMFGSAEAPGDTTGAGYAEKASQVTDAQLETAEISREAFKQLEKNASVRQRSLGMNMLSGVSNEGIRKSRQKIDEISANDFTIKTHPKDTLRMEGGTKFGDETNTLLKSLLGEMRKSTVLKLDSNTLVQKAIETTYK